MKIGIIGGGITGLTTALALRKYGISSVVYEQAAALNEVGAGIWLQPNALKVLDWLGIKQEIKNQGLEIDKMAITNDQLIPLKKIKSEVVQDEDGNKTTAIHRARLQNILYNEVLKTNEIQLNKKYVSHTLKNNEIQVQFENGEATVDILLAADGVDSAVRQDLFSDTITRDTGQICWRGISKMNLPPELYKLGQEAWGKQIRFGFSQIGEGEVYWFAVVKAKQVKNAHVQDQKKYLADTFQGFSPIVGQLIANTDFNNIHKATLKDLKRIPTWHNDKICLIGDAAHATTPNMGQGACQGIEDAYYLSKQLSESPNDMGAAFEAFQQKRRKKVDYIVNSSWQFGKMAHSAIAQPMVKFILKITPESVMNSQMNKLYALDKK